MKEKLKSSRMFVALRMPLVGEKLLLQESQPPGKGVKDALITLGLLSAWLSATKRLVPKLGSGKVGELLSLS